MQKKQDTVICISGAGLVGALWSVLLAKDGYRLKVFERRPDLRKVTDTGGRSINLALSDRGWKALQYAGLADAVFDVSIPMYGRKIHDPGGRQRFLPYGKKNQAIYSVSRSGLNAILLDEAERFDNVELFFSHRTRNIDPDQNRLQVTNDEDGSDSEVKYDLLFGTDGAFSRVRDCLVKTDRFNYCQEYIAHGYKELSIPPDSNGKWQLDKNCLHIWPRKSFMLIALPNLDGSFTVTLFLAFDGKENAFSRLNTGEKVKEFFNREFEDAYALMPGLTDDFFSNPTGSLVTIRCEPWHYGGRICLMGDAAHAIVPFFGQGMNAGFEDCSILYELFKEYSDRKMAIKTFSRSRKPDADAIADLALENFVEMRDKVADEHFLLKKALEKKITEAYPEKWRPLYTMVTFEHTPYSKAQQKGREQDRILETVIRNEDVDQLLKDEKSLVETIEKYL